MKHIYKAPLEELEPTQYATFQQQACISNK